MSYIGQRPVVGRYIKLDQISSGFNGSNTGFSMTAGSQAVFPGTARNLLLSLGGVIQEPDTDFTISGSTLTFTTPPVANTTFFGVIYGDMQATGTPSDGTVLPASIASSGHFKIPQLTVNEDGADVDFRVEGDTEANLLFVDASTDRVGIGTSSPAALLTINVDTEANLGSGSEGIRLTSGASNAQFVRLGSSYSNGSVTGPGALLYSSNKLSIRCDNGNPITFHTGSTVAERMRIDASGRVLIGTTTEGSSASDDLTIASTGTTGVTIRSGTSNNGNIEFSDGTSGQDEYRGVVQYAHSDNSMRFYTDAAEKVRISSSGNVGIGTTSPGSIFHVQPLDETNFLVRNEGSTVVLASETNSGRDNNRGMALEATAFEFIEGGSEKMRLDSSGRVGIGTTSPSAKLHVVEATSTPAVKIKSGTNTNQNTHITLFNDNDVPLNLGVFGSSAGAAGAIGANTPFISSNSSAGLAIAANHASGFLKFGTGSSQTERMRIDSSGRVGIGTTSPAQLLEIHGDSNPAILLKDTTNNVLSYLYSQDLVGAVGTASNHPFVFNVNNGEKMRITSAGLVGIGTTSPSTTLHLDSGSTPTTIQIDSDTESSIDFNDHGGSAKRYKVGTNISSNDGQLEIKDITANVERVRIDTDGHVIAAKSIVSENLPGRNILINGDMRVAQRATSASVSSSGNTYDVCDRWVYNRNGVTGTLAQVNEVPDGSGFTKSLKLTTTSAVGSIAAGNMISFAYAIEGQDIKRLGYGSSDAKTATLSFWVRGSLSGKIGVNCTRDSRTFSANEDIVANTWKFVEIVIPADTSTALSAGDTANGFNLAIRFAAGSNFTSGTTGGSWISFHTAYAAGFTAGQQGAYLTTNGSTMQVTGVQLEIGSKATPFDHKCFTEQLQKCKRYYYKSMEYGVPTTQPIALATNSTTVDLDGFNGWIMHSTTGCRSPIFDHPVEMRALPTVQIYSSGRVAGQSTNDVLAIYDGSAWVNCSSNSPRHNTRKIAFLGSVSSALTQFGAFLFGGGYDCDAEL